MQLSNIIVVNTYVVMATTIAVIYMVNKMLERKASGKRLLLFTLIYSVMVGIMISVITFPDIQTKGFVYFSYLLLRVTSSVCGTFFLRFVYGARDFRSYLYMDIFVQEFLCVPKFIFDNSLAALLRRYLHGFDFAAAHSILATTLCVILGVIMAKFLFRTKFKKAYIFLMEIPSVCLAIVIVYSILDCFLLIMSNSSREWGKWDGVWNITRIVFIMVIPIIAREFIRKRKLRESQELIVQQQIYLSRLEDVQSQLRMIQHDYKNMISGLYTQVTEGNIGEAKKYMDEKLIRVDQHIQSEIQQINQITKIKDPSLKSLIITKIMMLLQQNTAVYIEIPYEIDQVSIEILDLIRCLGILLDNAMEAVAGHEDATVVLVMLNEADKLFIMIKNDIYADVDIAKIYQEGYSTKGVNRGLGLSSLRQIIQKYEHVIQEMRIEEGQFIQSITVMQK